MADVVVFPGSTDHIETEDVNLLDADTAHVQQSVGSWIRETSRIAQPSQSSDLAAAFGSLEGTVSVVTAHATTSAAIQDAGTAPVTPGITYSITAMIAAAQGGQARIRIRWLDSGGTRIDDSPTTVSGVAPAGSVTAQAMIDLGNTGGGLVLGHVYYFDAVCIREGTDPTFVPSLRIVGTLGETIDPPDMPIVYAADGTPLTVGEGWAGEGVEYTRYDGDVGVGPIVAQFLASDLP